MAALYRSNLAVLGVGTAVAAIAGAEAAAFVAGLGRLADDKLQEALAVVLTASPPAPATGSTAAPAPSALLNEVLAAQALVFTQLGAVFKNLSNDLVGKILDQFEALHKEGLLVGGLGQRGAVMATLKVAASAPPPPASPTSSADKPAAAPVLTPKSLAISNLAAMVKQLSDKMDSQQTGSAATPPDVRTGEGASSSRELLFGGQSKQIALQGLDVIRMQQPINTPEPTDLEVLMAVGGVPIVQKIVFIVTGTEPSLTDPLIALSGEGAEAAAQGAGEDFVTVVALANAGLASLNATESIEYFERPASRQIAISRLHSILRLAARAGPGARSSAEVLGTSVNGSGKPPPGSARAVPVAAGGVAKKASLERVRASSQSLLSSIATNELTWQLRAKSSEIEKDPALEALRLVTWAGHLSPKHARAVKAFLLSNGKALSELTGDMPAQLIEAREAILAVIKAMLEAVVGKSRVLENIIEIDTLAEAILCCDVDFPLVVKLLGGKKPSSDWQASKQGKSVVVHGVWGDVATPADIERAMNALEPILSIPFMVAGLPPPRSACYGLVDLAASTSEFSNKDNVLTVFKDVFNILSFGWREARIDLNNSLPIFDDIVATAMGAEGIGSLMGWEQSRAGGMAAAKAYLQGQGIKQPAGTGKQGEEEREKGATRKEKRKAKWEDMQSQNKKKSADLVAELTATPTPDATSTASDKPKFAPVGLKDLKKDMITTRCDRANGTKGGMVEIWERVMASEQPDLQRDQQPCPFGLGNGLCKSAQTEPGCKRCKAGKHPSTQCLKALKASCSAAYLASLPATSAIKSA